METRPTLTINSDHLSFNEEAVRVLSLSEDERLNFLEDEDEEGNKIILIQKATQGLKPSKAGRVRNKAAAVSLGLIAKTYTLSGDSDTDSLLQLKPIIANV